MVEPENFGVAGEPCFTERPPSNPLGWPASVEHAFGAMCQAERAVAERRSVGSIAKLETARRNFDTAIVEWQYRQRLAALARAGHHRSTQRRRANGDAWLTQRQIAALFEVDRVTVTEHVGAVLKDGECDPGATSRKFRLVQSEGKRAVSREVAHYSTEMVMAVGYRVRSPRGIEFRQWVTAVIRRLMWPAVRGVGC